MLVVVLMLFDMCLHVEPFVVTVKLAEYPVFIIRSVCGDFVCRTRPSQCSPFACNTSISDLVYGQGLDCFVCCANGEDLDIRRLLYLSRV